MPATLKFCTSLPPVGSLAERECLVVGHKHILTLHGAYEASKSGISPGGEVSKELFTQALKDLSPSQTTDAGDTVPLYMKQAAVSCLPIKCSRTNCPSRPDALANLVKPIIKRNKDCAIVVICPRTHVVASSSAIARSCQLYDAKSTASTAPYAVTVCFVLCDADSLLGGDQLSDKECYNLGIMADGVRLAARLVDAPTSEMDTSHMVAEAQRVAAELGGKVRVSVVTGSDLEKGGFGGLWAVGKAAEKPPSLVTLEYDGGSEEVVALVGKGIVYDTGGLSIKSKDGMPTMKRDMGGAAAVLGAFQAAVKIGTSKKLRGVLCLAENAVSKEAYRPDDIIYMLSGKTVEVNNTDAEGRMVLGDGVHYAAATLKASTVVNICTLTGAQKIAAGNKHAGIMCNDETLEHTCVSAGRACGDLCIPLLYCPELLMKEFKSEVADMKNSVKDRGNAQASCAGHFIESHLPKMFHGKWLHVDMAGPNDENERATGYGVCLFLQLFANPVVEGN
mmetsp:Transcript_31337/g.78845  ORF Transcript_31337/g.78845 Transcript_31337/m.78845 type:complete len:506 (+) Transcript_31337:144-1661(+)